MAAGKSPPKGGARAAVASVLQGIFFVGYPLVIYLAHSRMDTRGAGSLLLGLYAASFLLRWSGKKQEFWQLAKSYVPLALLIGLAIALDQRVVLLWLPMLVTLYLFGTFAWSLVEGPPMIERFARLAEDDLPPFTHSYCRGWTVLWCVFMLANAVGVGVLATAAPLEWWALYTGMIFYLLLALMLGAEFVMRKIWFRYYQDGWIDAAFARVFPAQNTARGRRSLEYDARRRAA